MSKFYLCVLIIMQQVQTVALISSNEIIRTALVILFLQNAKNLVIISLN